MAEDPAPDGAATPSPYVLVEGIINSDYQLQLYIDDLATGEPSFPLLLIGEFDDKTLVAVPHAAWHRSLSKRRMQQGALSRATVVEVLTASASSGEVHVPDNFMKCWVGYLKPDLMAHIQTLEHLEDCVFTFGLHAGEEALPAVESLVAAANDHFAFFSAAEDAADGEGDQDTAQTADFGGAGLAALQGRVTQMEGLLEKLSNGMNQLLEGANPPKAAPATSRPSALRTSPKYGATPRVQFPALDQGVVEAALQAGVPPQSLAQMERTQNSRAQKVQDSHKSIILDPLSEQEDEVPQVSQRQLREESGSPPRDAYASSIDKLTEIVALLAEDKKKHKSLSRLDLALDSAQGSGSSDSLSLGSGKKTAAARRALRSTFQEHPEEIYQTIEKLMYEDLASQTLGPGQQPLGLNARAWVEFRSRITNYKTGAFCAWSLAGILDALVAGRYDQARARACLGLLQLDQAAIDRGSWAVAGELNLEQMPPMSALSAHVGPNVQDGESPFSKLLDARWAEIMVGFLRDQEDFVTKRRALGRPGAAKNNDEDNKEGSGWAAKRKAKAKAKSTAAAERGQEN